MMGIILNPKISNYRFIHYFLSNIDFGIFVNEGAIPSVNKKTLSKIPTPLLPLPEQKRIVAKLDSIFKNTDKAITKVEENIKYLDDLWQSVLSEVFEDGEEKWELKTVDDIAFVKGGKRLSKGDKLIDQITEHPYLRVKDFSQNGNINVEDLKYLNDYAFSKISNYTISSKDFYISIAGTIGRTGIIQDFLEGSNLTENAAKLVFKTDVNLKYFYYFTLSNNFKNQVSNSTKAVAQPKLALTRIRKMHIYFAPFPEQKKIVSYLDSVSEQIEKLKTEQTAKLENLKNLKASVLDSAFKGKI